MLGLNETKMVAEKRGIRKERSVTFFARNNHKNLSNYLLLYLFWPLFLMILFFGVGSLQAAAVKGANKTAEIDKEALKKAQEFKVVRAIRLNEPIKLDGLLEEEVWKINQPASDFLQRDPLDGVPASEKTEVWVAYDEANLYVAAYCHDSDPKGIVGLLGRRDSFVDSDWFFFA
ncbi:MAG: hypothetical protein ACPLRA_06315, partial [Candidatus Saccharicenans sp.]